MTCAGGDPVGDAESLAETFQPLVKEVYWIPVTINNTSPNKDPAVLEQVKACGGIYFSGGDQTNLLYCFYDNLATPSPLLQQLYAMNKVLPEMSFAHHIGVGWYGGRGQQRWGSDHEWPQHVDQWQQLQCPCQWNLRHEYSQATWTHPG